MSLARTVAWINIRYGWRTLFWASVVVLLAAVLDFVPLFNVLGYDFAFAIGLANRLAPKGGALDAAVELAAQLSAFPQLCMRNDRLSAIGQWSLDWDQATAAEIALGMEVLRSGASQEGAARFAAGEGRGGKF